MPNVNKTKIHTFCKQTDKANSMKHQESIELGQFDWNIDQTLTKRLENLHT